MPSSALPARKPTVPHPTLSTLLYRPRGVQVHAEQADPRDLQGCQPQRQTFWSISWQRRTLSEDGDQKDLRGLRGLVNLSRGTREAVSFRRGMVCGQ
jgi:hypothetical protein